MFVRTSSLDKFTYFGIFSAGIGGLKADLEERNADFFANPELSNARVKLFWIGAGNNDQLIGDGEHPLCDALRSHGIAHEFHESEGGHTWINWRRYFYEFAQRLFRD